MNRNDILRVSFQGLDLDLAATAPMSQHRFETYFFSMTTDEVQYSRARTRMMGEVSEVLT